MATAAFQASSGSRYGFVRSLMHACLLCLLLVLCGCAQKVLPAAVKLGQAGQEATTQMQKSTVLSDDQLAMLGKSTLFRITLEKSACEEMTPKESASDCTAIYDKEIKLFNTIVEIQNKLTAEEKWLVSLHDAYAALGELAAYDAKTNFTTAISNLTSSTNTLAKTLGASALPTLATDATSALGSQAIDFAKTRKIVAASKDIHIQLNAAVEMLSSADVQDAYTYLQKQYLSSTEAATKALLDNNAVSYKQVVNDIGSITGFSAIGDIDTRVRNNPHLKKGLVAIASEIFKQKVKKINLAFHKSIEALKALQKLHTELESDSELSFSQITEAIDQLKTLSSTTTNSK